MNCLNRIFFAGFLLASVAAFPLGWVQATGVALSSASPQATALPDTPTPRGSAFPSTSLATKKKSANSSRAGRARAETTGVSRKTDGTLQQLCFQPGVGWLHPPQFYSGANVPSQTAGTLSCTSKVEEHEASRLDVYHLGQAAQLERATNPGSGQSQIPGTTSTGLPESLRNPALHNATNPASGQSQVPGTTSTGLPESLRNLALHNAANPGSGQSQVPGTTSTGLPESLRNVALHNYVSPIKLRRVTRGAPRLETRLNLDRLAIERRAPMENGKKRSAKNNCNRQTEEDDETRVADQYTGTAPCRLNRGQ
jgi:hypothetical protein